MATAKKSSTKTTSTKKKATSAAKKAVTEGAAPSVSIPKAVVAETKAVVSGPVLKKKELIDRVVAMSGGKKKDVKPAVEATLAVLGAAIAKGEELNLQPLGKLMIKNRTEKANGEVINCRIRQAKPSEDKAPTDTLAAAAE